MTVPKRGILGLVFLLALAVAAVAAPPSSISSFRLGDNTGEDWEPAIIADGSYVYEFWPHYAATSYKDTSGATCMPFGSKGGNGGTTTSYMYFQSSSNGGTNWSTVVIPRCPVNGNTVDAQLWLGSGAVGSRRLYASYMDGNAQYTPIEVIYSDDHGSTWSAPVDATNGGHGDKDMLLVDGSNNVSVAYENGGKQYVSVSTNGGASFTVHPVTIYTKGVILATGAAMDTHGNRYYAWSGTSNNGNGPTTFYLQRSNNLFSSYTVSTIDEGAGEPQVSGAGWDYWGGSVQVAVQPKSSGNDRIVAVYNAGLVNGGPERIFTKYSDTLGASWNIPFNANSWPNGTGLSLAPTGVWHGFPSISGTSSVVKVIWMDNRASAGGNYTCLSSSTEGQCGTWNLYVRSSADGATNWSAETAVAQATPYLDYTSVNGFDHPYGDYSETVNDGTNFYSCWGEGQSYTLSGNVYYAKY
jgi:hypothetical protein